MVATISAGFGLVVSSLLMGLLESHFRRLRPWDRPRGVLTPAFALVWTPARRVVLVIGLGAILRGSRPAAAATAGALFAMLVYLRWVRSEGHARRHLEKVVEKVRRGRTGGGVAETMRTVLFARHPEWGADLIQRIIDDHPDPRSFARTVVRLERQAFPGR